MKNTILEITKILLATEVIHEGIKRIYILTNPATR